jgi:IclR family pca regulon transcriptional regulator
LDNADIIDRFERSDRTRTTPRTVTTAADLLEAVAAVRAQGWALLDQELEVGVRSVAAPLRQRDLVVAAVNVSTSAGRTDLDELHATVLPALLETADAISTALGMQ